MQLKAKYLIAVPMFFSILLHIMDSVKQNKYDKFAKPLTRYLSS